MLTLSSLFIPWQLHRRVGTVGLVWSSKKVACLLRLNCQVCVRMTDLGHWQLLQQACTRLHAHRGTSHTPQVPSMCLTQLHTACAFSFASPSHPLLQLTSRLGAMIMIDLMYLAACCCLQLAATVD